MAWLRIDSEFQRIYVGASTEDDQLVMLMGTSLNCSTNALE